MHKRMGNFLTWRRMAGFLLAGLLLLAGCKSAAVNAPAAALPGNLETIPATRTAVPTSTATPTPPPTRTPVATPTATPSPTPSPTPTPRAEPITLSGDPRAAILSDPVPQNNAQCGIVDLLNFPLDPPDALDVRYGGQGFGRYRDRYEQYHAGEDWQLLRGSSNLGVPVYAIGHGQVTYAQPYGWGRDKGVIIVRHTFAGGSTVLSFYGHMDPDSVTLRAGDCVVRGQKIAEIGQPRTPPHLHFEIRTHMPEEPGPGYWPVDPTEAGWLPPSAFIWSNRMAAMPGVAWTRPFTTRGWSYIGQAGVDTLLALEDGRISVLDPASGRLTWRHPMTETVTAAMVNVDGSQLVTASSSGQLAAYSLAATAGDAGPLPADPLWRVDIERFGSPTLHPLPSGGVVVSVWGDLTAISARGNVLWQAEVGGRPLEWLLTRDRLLMTVTGSQGPVFSMTANGLESWPIPLSGRLANVGDQIWLYARDGLYRLDPDAGMAGTAAMAEMPPVAELLYQLPSGAGDPGGMIALPGGGAMIAHRERGDNRLIAFDADGAVRWQRSIAQLRAGEQRLLLHNGRPYLLVQSGSDMTTQFKLYAIDMDRSTLTHIFTGGTRTPLSVDNWIISAGNRLLLINVGGGGMAALNPEVALSLVNRAADGANQY